MSEPILTVNHLSFGFRDQQLYQDLSFSVECGLNDKSCRSKRGRQNNLNSVTNGATKTASRNDSLSATATGSIGLCAPVPEC